MNVYSKLCSGGCCDLSSFQDIDDAHCTPCVVDLFYGAPRCSSTRCTPCDGSSGPSRCISPDRGFAKTPQYPLRPLPPPSYQVSLSELPSPPNGPDFNPGKCLRHRFPNPQHQASQRSRSRPNATAKMLCIQQSKQYGHAKGGKLPGTSWVS